ncbi:DUF1643 domain-containing protein [Enterococcus ratti]|uniref:DUF1643 domain-containing protein n=1 Tax=Enterococcus ratti TaxID=150033 RepID=UPI0035119C2B
MIEKELVNTQTEVWRDPDYTHRYVFKCQWAIKGKKEKEELAVVITIRPTDTEAFTNDLSMLLIEKNIRQLGFTGFIAVNLFSYTKAKSPRLFSRGNDEQSLEALMTVLAEKKIKTIIFACGSIMATSQVAYEQAKTIYDQLSAKQKKMTKVLINAEGKLSHPLSIHVRNEWQLADSQLLFQEK